MIKIGLLVLAAALVLFLASACSVQEQAEETGVRTISLEEAQGRLREHIQSLQNKAYIVRKYVDNQHIQTYYQDGSGNWREERPETEGSSDQESGSRMPQELRPEAFIYNASESKAWLIVGTTAYEITDPEYIKLQHQAAAPISAEIGQRSTGHYSQAGENGIWEWRISQKEQAIQMTVTLGVPYEQLSDEESWSRMEFLGPEGLLSRQSAGPIQNRPGRAPLENSYEYSQLGDVQPELFELPDSVKEVKNFEEYFKLIEASGWMPSD
jgi:hypothetical protein